MATLTASILRMVGNSEVLMRIVKKVKKFNFCELYAVEKILYECGKNMACNEGLLHWNNSHIKNYLIIIMCLLKNNVFLVYDDFTPIATFQTRKVDQAYLFQKLAVFPKFSWGGIGSYCMAEIERLAKECGCTEVICEVYDKSEHAKKFYEHRGYKIYGSTKTLKYNELKLRKEL